MKILSEDYLYFQTIVVFILLDRFSGRVPNLISVTALKDVF